MKKIKQLNLKLTAEEYELFEELRVRTGLSKVDFFKRRVLDQDYLIKTINDKHENIKEELDGYIAWHVDNSTQEMKKELGEFLERKILTTMADALTQIDNSIYKTIRRANGWRVE